MAVTIDGLFGLQQMGESVALFDQGSGPLPLKDGVFKSEECYGDVYRFDREDFEISLAPFVAGRETASKQIKTQDKKVEFISLAYIRVHKVLTAARLFTQRQPGELMDDAPALVAKTRKQLRQRVKMSIERLCAMALRGSIVINPANFPDTDISITAQSRAVTALTAPVLSWDNIAANLVSKDIQVWRKQMKEATGYPTDAIMFNESVTQMLMKNTEIRDWIQRTQTGVNTFQTAMFEKMGGLAQWIENGSFYKPEGGSATEFISDKEAFLLPPSAMDNCRLIEGFGEIPDEAIGAGPGMGVGATRAPQKGLFEWASRIPGGDPAGIKLGCGWYGIPLVKIPTAVGYRADVTSIV